MHIVAYYPDDRDTVLLEKVIFSVGGGTIEVFGKEKLEKVSLCYKDCTSKKESEIMNYFYAPLK